MTRSITPSAHEPKPFDTPQKNDNIAMNEMSTATKDIYRNDEWRRRDFDEDYIKNTLNEFKMAVSDYQFLFFSKFLLRSRNSTLRK
jgi:hypothetical protein